MSEDVFVQEDTQPQRAIEYDDQPASARGGCGCWIPAILTLLVAVALVAVGLFLPPVNLYNRLFGVQYTPLSADSNAVRSTDGGLTVLVDPAQPGTGFGVALASAGGDTPENAGAVAAAPPSLTLQSPVYNVQTTGTAPETVTLSLTLPPTTPNTDVLDLYGWDAETAQWRFVPAHAAVPGTLTATVREVPDKLALFQARPLDQPTVLVAVDAAQVLSSEAGQLATIVAPGGLQPTLEGKLTGSLAAGFELNRGYLVMPVIRNYADPRAIDIDTVTTITGSRALRAQHVGQLTAFAAGGGFAGVMIDYRDVPADQRDSFSAFITELGKNFDQQGLLLGVVVPAARNVDGNWDTGAYDWQAIGQAADYVQVNLGLDPEAYAPGSDRPVEAMLRWGVDEISRYKLLLGLSALSVRSVDGQFTPIGYQDALSALGNVTVEAQTSDSGSILPGSEIRASLDGFQAVAGTDTVVQSPFIDFMGDNEQPVARVWLTTPEALRFRMDRAAAFGLAGVAFEDLLASGVADGVFQTIINYKLGMPTQPGQGELALRWRIESASGVVSEVTTGLNEPLVTTIEAPEGNYAINVAVVGANIEKPRSGAAVALFAPTPTPTPIPTATPTPTPSPTPSPAPVVQQPAQPAQPAGGAAPAAPGAGSIAVGNFEYGGHVTSTSSDVAANAMRRAGMNWMKVQIRYSGGMSPGAAAEHINGAKARGFKILLAVVGNPAELGAGGQGYIQQFAQFLGGVAALGPDAIEVWNEPNIDREWPTGQISGATFATMLQAAYPAIKGANGSVMVISGAPAPTGAEGAFPGQVVNDDRFIAEFVAAGGLNAVDCVGAHYNEGIVGPNQRNGDPRDNYYTRYFWGMMDTYWNLIGGQKPICFTELGYLSPEGLGPLPDFFSWAQNVSVAQQAAWLAQAAALSSQSGKVRLMIVWNVDFTLYGSDPQAGYAMIRPGGGCPACDAMAAAR
ncbi:MAG: hypothetical protein HZC41_26810 [Chloroflexi bacterium]|nr:hypothetical protein [Chloroflexota bacterium]